MNLACSQPPRSRARFLRPRLCALAITATTVVVVGAAAGCDAKFGPGGPEAGESSEAKEEKASPVVTAKVGRSSVVATVSSSSTIEAERRVTVHAESTGRISKLGYEEGQRVAAGATLAQVQRDAQSSQLDRASTNLEKATADFARIQGLYDKGAASREELDNARLALQTAKIDRKDRRREVGDTRVVAPFAGTITERFVNDGAFVTNGAQLYSIVDFDSLVARVFVPEREIDRIRVGQEAVVVHKTGSGRRGVGSVQRIAPIVDVATGTVKITVALPSELTGEGGFLPGMYAEVTLTTAQHDDVIVLPKPALIHEEEQTFAFVAEGDRARRVLLQTGLADEDQVEILAGVDEGAEVILVGHAGLKDGALIVRVDEQGAALPSASSPSEAGPAAVAAAASKAP